MELTIDVLGNMIESSDLSPNRTFYGDLHNWGHIFTAYVHDPENKYLVYYSLNYLYCIIQSLLFYNNFLIGVIWSYGR